MSINEFLYGDISKLKDENTIQLLDDSQLSYQLNRVKAIQKQVDLGNTSWQQMSDNIAEADKWIMQYGMDSQGTTRSIDDLKNANVSAKESIVAQNAAIEAQGLKAKATTLTLKALSAALNVGVSLAISAGISWIYKQIQAHKEQIEAAKEAAKIAKEESDNLSRLLIEYNNLSNAVKNNSGSKEQLMSVQAELLEALGIEEAQIEKLVKKYGTLDNAINQVTLDALKDAEANLLIDVGIKESELLKAGGKNPFFNDDLYVDIDHSDLVKKIKSLNLDGLQLRRSGTAGEFVYLETLGDTSTVEGIHQNYNAMVKLRDELKSVYAAEGKTNELKNLKFYMDLTDEINNLSSAYDNYTSSIDAYNNSQAQIQTISSLKGHELPKTMGEFEAFKQQMIDTATASGHFVGSQEDIADSVTNALAAMPEFKQYFGDLKTAQEEAIQVGSSLASSTEDQISEFTAERIEAGNCGQALATLQLIKLLVNSTQINTSTDIEHILALANAAGITSSALVSLENAKKQFDIASASGDKQGMTLAARGIHEARQKLTDDISNLKAPDIEFNGSVSPSSNSGASAADAYLEAFEKELSQLDSLKDRGKITEKQYLDALRKLYVKYYKDKEKYIDQYEKYEHQYLSGMKSMYESAFSYITKLIDKRIDAFQKESNSQVTGLEAQKKASEDYYQSQIDEIDGQIKAKQELIDAINGAAEARKREIDLQKAQYDLERMQNQRTTYVYKEGKGFVYEADTSGIADARESVESAKREIEVSNIQKSIDGLEKQKEALEEALEASNAYWDTQIEQTKNYFDSLISGMEEYKSRWTELSELQENVEMLNLLQELGYTEEEVLNMSSGAFEDFKQKYLGILKDMSDGNQGLMNSLSEIANIDMGKVPGYLKETQEYIDSLSNMNVGALSEAVNAVGEGFGSVAEAAGKVSSVLTGNGGTGKESSSADGGAQSNRGGTGGSLQTAINTLSTDGVKNINKVAAAFAGESDDSESGVSVASAVQQVIDKIGSGSANPDETGAEVENDSDSLMSAISQQTTAALNKESGIPAQVTAWKELNTPLKEADDYITSIKDSLTDMDGKTFTITLDVNGGSSHGESGLSRGENGTVGKAFADGSTDYHNVRNLPITGYKGLPSDEKNALRSEYGQPELTVYPNGTTELTTEPVMSHLPKGTVIFNEEQTLRIMKNKGTIIGRAYAHGASSNLPSHLTSIDLTSESNTIFRKFNEYIGNNIAALTPSMDIFKNNLESINRNFNSMVQNNQGPRSMNQVFNITMPNVTNSTSAETLMRDLQSLGTKKMQFFN